MFLTQRLLIAVAILAMVSIPISRAQAVSSSGYNSILGINWTAELYLGRYSSLTGAYAQGQGKTTLNATTFGLVRSEYVRVTVQQKLANGSVINPGGSPNPCSKEESIFYTAQCTAYSPKIVAVGNYRAISRHSFYARSNGAEINVTNLSTYYASFAP